MHKSISLHNKILVSMTTLLLLLGLGTTLITRTVLLRVFRTEFQHKLLSYARSLAANSVVDILTQNSARLKKLIENEKSLDKDIAYIFIMDSSGRVLAHTFAKGFPVDLAKANSLKRDRAFNIQSLDTQLGLIYDICVPIFLEKSIVGQARVGLLQNSIQRMINTINLIFISVTLLLIVIGIFSAYLMIEEIKQLTLVKERNRIALDLHDGCAQDLADIIKRLELCERLFKIEPMRAIEELKELRENTKDTLDRTRQIIFDLKFQEDNGFDLFNRLERLVKDYEKINDILVKLDISGAKMNIPPIKAKTIFYIIKEAFSNIQKHSQAKNVALKIELNNNSLKILIKDDWIGFDIRDRELATSSDGRCGLIGMRERAIALGGQFVIDSRLQQGTRIQIGIPNVDKEL